MDNFNQSGFGYNQSGQTVVGDYPARENIVVSNNAKYTLLSISKWVKFMSIVGIVMAALLVLFGIVIIGVGGTAFSKFSNDDFGGAGTAFGAFVGVIYIIIAAIYLYPIIKMLNYANKMKKAVTYNRQDYYENALNNFKSGVTFMGVLTIIGLAFYALAIVGFIIGTVMRSY